MGRRNFSIKLYCHFVFQILPWVGRKFYSFATAEWDVLGCPMEKKAPIVAIVGEAQGARRSVRCRSFILPWVGCCLPCPHLSPTSQKEFFRLKSRCTANMELMDTAGQKRCQSQRPPPLPCSRGVSPLHFEVHGAADIEVCQRWQCL
jgi:hypothetical protein